ncbi:hypothetical protein I5Q34_31985 [Streptomyces sp. AV19]|uniref:hypothetical protein n=1 Tax=Streptomyces sp. AV19 TaxID=2793068 RepID=UPI0018FE7EC5|nr:hypothetical protein [Streptomyces sp. AV19]MBH1938827.1 hypothetical protein [Streptomyces sp. AV19]MDG4534760.1 hypothetical protein [Streptomyces sp. AV19]
MSVLSVLHIPSAPRLSPTGVRTALRTALRRIADGAADSPVLHALDAPAARRP